MLLIEIDCTHEFILIVTVYSDQTNPDQIPSWRGEFDTKFYPYSRIYCQLITAGRGRGIFFKRVDSRKLVLLQRKAKYPTIYRKHKLNLMGMGRKRTG